MDAIDFLFLASDHDTLDTESVFAQNLNSKPNTPTIEGPMWGHPMLVLGALFSLLEPFCGHLSPKIDKVS